MGIIPHWDGKNKSSEQFYCDFILNFLYKRQIKVEMLHFNAEEFF